MTRHWVVIETGGNQRYIFESNRMRHVVGASQLVLDAGTSWVKAAKAGLTGIEEVQSISGRALLLAESADEARQLIRRVSHRALAEAPGLEVTGAIGPPFDESLPYRERATTAESDPATGVSDATGDIDYVTALRRTHKAHARARADRPSPLLRDRTLPWHLPCRETGLPATVLEPFGPTQDGGSETHPASATVAARSTARDREETKRRLARLLGEHTHLEPKIVDDLTSDGWIAVVHADGNAVGRLFHEFPSLVMKDPAREGAGRDELSLSDYQHYLAEFSRALDEVTRQAFTDAVAETVGGLPREETAGRLLPIVVGGDDVTFACHAALALPLTRAFLRRFAKGTRADGRIARLATALHDQPGTRAGLTAAAGIAIVKRHHPFAAAYTLAEELTTSAKRAVRVAPDQPVSAYDVHIAHESTLRPLADLRAALMIGSRENPVDRHGGPYVLDDATWPIPAPLEKRSDTHLRELMRALADGTLSSARAHDLRGALDRGPAEYRARLTIATARIRSERARAGEPLAPSDEKALTGLLQPVGTDGVSGHQFVRLIDALLLHGIDPARSTTEQTGASGHEPAEAMAR